MLKFHSFRVKSFVLLLAFVTHVEEHKIVIRKSKLMKPWKVSLILKAFSVLLHLLTWLIQLAVSDYGMQSQETVSND